MAKRIVSDFPCSDILKRAVTDQLGIGKYLRFDTIYCSDNFSGFSPRNRLTHVEITNHVLATFQLLGLSIVCEFRYSPFVSLITCSGQV